MECVILDPYEMGIMYPCIHYYHMGNISGNMFHLKAYIAFVVNIINELIGTMQFDKADTS